jgi:TIGR00299 family protein
MKTLYLECYSGISGDMTVGALLDLGADPDVLKAQLGSLPVKGYKAEISRVRKSGLAACDFNVILDKEHENHDHDNEYLYGHHGHPQEVHGHDGHGHQEYHHEEHAHSHGSHSQPEHLRHHEHSHTEHLRHHEHSHAEHPHHHDHRGLPEILRIIENSQMTERARIIASDIFRVLAEAEAKAHGTSLEEVHFHEVGAVDSIVDIAAVAICLDNLGITDVIVPELYEGRGVIRCQHGLIPVPVPATANIAQSHGISLHMTDTEAELVTPTGAAIVAAVRTSDRLPARYRILKTGLGAGKRDYGRTSILRAMLIDEDPDTSDIIYKLETNIDDCTGEALGYVMERLLEAGARDVHYIPVFMKKNRPAWQLNIICREEQIQQMEEIIFRETTTIGIRRMRMERTVLNRRLCTAETSLGTVEIKICSLNGSERIYPEYESISRISRESGRSYQEVWSLVCRELWDSCDVSGTTYTNI